mmetsp:Transcript_23478/g.36172  ORF Transcript_23478/g.36172 Transcript_23478/m.36172 type:complete len:316 (-) Transcript_23478:2014-2961(-)
MDDGLGGDFTSVQGFDSDSLITHWTTTDSVLKGRSHRFRYRAKNDVGWGDFSDISTILAATVPSTPSMPTFVSFTDATKTLTITVGESSDNGGTAITTTSLYVDQGDDYTSAFSLAGTPTTYQYELTTSGHGLVEGRIYRFKTQTENAIGSSEFSDIAYIAFGDVPGAPGTPTRESSTRTSITISWTAPTTTSDDIEITGYVLNADDGINKDLSPIYTGLNRPEILEYTAGGLTTGLPYLFSVQAINKNGYSSHSTNAIIYPCVAPPTLATPTYVSSDQTAKTITVEWTKPTDNGGCSLLGFRLYRTAGSTDYFD